MKSFLTHILALAFAGLFTMATSADIERVTTVEIDRNVLLAAVSIPKYAGGPAPKSGRTFHIHHNYFRDGYSIEFVRNGVEIDRNLFDLVS